MPHLPLTRRRALSLAGLSAVGLALAACGRDAGAHRIRPGSEYSPLTGRIKGAGASSQSDAQDAWIGEFFTYHPHATVEYAAEGSGAGREKFMQGAVDFAASDSAMNERELERVGEVLELPLYISPIAVVYNVPGFEGEQHLTMSAQTIARVFSGEITTWNDPQIAAENPGAELPELRIIAVHRSDESGTTKTFTRYLHEAAPADWPHESEETWPITGGQSGDGTSGVIQTIAGASGAIGYADASKVPATLGSLAVDGVPYSAEAAAATLDASELAADATAQRLVYEVNYQAEGTYPIILVSYMLSRLSYDDAELAETLKEYLLFAASSEGQAAASAAAGSAPISDALRAQVVAAIETLQVSGTSSEEGE